MSDETIFATALEKPAEARAAYLAEACGNDEALRKRLEKLLAASEKVGNFMANPAVAPDPDPAATEALTGTPEPGAAAEQITCGETSASDDEALTFLAPGTRPDAIGRIGHYEVLQVLGRGGFGIVFRAFDEVLQRVVALKVMAPQLAATSPARKRFLREARSSAQVRHENVVQVYEIGEQPLPYLAMEFIPGETLQQKLDRVGPLDVPEVLRIGRQIAEGLAAAHATDLIHRDIKPGNVLLEGGQDKVKITDFGLARTADDASISQSGIIAGTPMYMAPEQAQGQTLDQRADLFSLGSVLYQMVAGRPPFRASTAVAVLKRVAEDTPRAIREIIPETPQWLCDIIAKLHAKNPDDRYQSAREVADVLADCEAQLKANAKLKDYSRIPRSKPQQSGRRKWVALAAAVLLPVIALLVMEFAGVTHLFRGQLATRDPIGTSGAPMPTAAGPPEVPKTAAGVLPFLAGSWKLEREDLDPKQPEGKVTFVGYLTYDYVAHGKVLRAGGSTGAGNEQRLFLHTYDLSNDTLRLWQAYSDGFTDGPTVGTFNPDTRSITWTRVGSTHNHQFSFVDPNTITTHMYRLDEKSNVIRLANLKFTRVKEPPTIPSLPTDPKRPDEMKVLDRLVGEWRNQITVSVAGPDTKVDTVRVKVEPILGSRFIEKFETNEATGASDYTVNWFDTDAKRYRSWFFNHTGSVTEFTGTWDEAAKTLTWNSPDGLLEGRWTFKGDDLREYRNIVKDKDGKVLNEAVGVSVRRVREVPKQAADVLPFVMGSWKTEEVVQVPKTPPELARSIGIITHEPIAGGKFVRAYTTNDDRRFETCQVLSFDEQQGTFRGWILDSRGEAFGPGLGIFDPEKRTILYTEKIPNGHHSINQFEFVDRNTVKRWLLIQNPKNDIVLDEHMTYTRLDKPTTGKRLPIDPKRPPEMKVLDRLLGDWHSKITIKDSAKPDKPKAETQRVKAESILAGRFMESYITNETNNTSDYALAWYDVGQHKYRQWYFNGGGYAFEMSGAWNEAAKTLTWTSPDGRLEGRWTFKSDDLREFVHLIKDQNGKTVSEAAGVSRRTAPAPVAPFTDADVQRIAALPAEQQVEEVRKELMRRNPGFDGKMETKIEDGVVTEFRIVTDKVTDIAPIRAWSALRVLDCHGTYTDQPNGLLADLTPLKGMSLAGLTTLVLNDTRVTDKGLANFKDCKNLTGLDLDRTQVGDAGLMHFKDCKALTHLWLGATKVSDVGLAHFKDCKNLTHLGLDWTQMGDAGLAQFKGMPLKALAINNTGITDLTPLHGMSLEAIFLTPKNITRGLDILRHMKSLKTIGIDPVRAWPAAEFWKRYDKGEFK
jgi:serine/threonine protein kinase